jgi:hypothetical protein
MSYDKDTLSFTTLIKAYDAMQAKVVSAVRALSSKGSCSANPGQFIMLQFQMANVTQIGESISNIISQVNSVIGNAIRNQKTQ